MSFWSAVGNFFNTIWNSTAFNKFKNFATQVFQAETPIILGALSNIALNAVSSVNAQNLTNTAARDAAFTAIATQAKAAGITAGDSAINLALEMAVTAIKNNTPATGNTGTVSAT